MMNAVAEEVMPAAEDEEDLYDEYYEEDRRLYEDPEFCAAMEEAMKEAEDIIAHPEKYKHYTSVKELLRDAGFDVSNLPDD